MTTHGEWTHIVDHAWERHSVGCQYTVHQENNGWVARGFSLSEDGAAVKKVEESARTLDAAARIVQGWESARLCQRV